MLVAGAVQEDQDIGEAEQLMEDGKEESGVLDDKKGEAAITEEDVAEEKCLAECGSVSSIPAGRSATDSGTRRQIGWSRPLHS
jgi:hypothetical protein